MSNLKQQTIKIPRRVLVERDQEHLLDVVLACSSQSIRADADSADRMAFEKDIAESKDISPRIKEALAKLGPEERRILFR
jgi:hypothetical protein